MNRLCPDVIRFIIQYISGFSNTTYPIIQEYFGDLYITVPDEIRKTFLRRYLQKENMPEDYLIIPYCMRHEIVSSEHKEYLNQMITKKIKLVIFPEYQKQNTTCVRYSFKNSLQELILPKTNIKTIVRFYGNVSNVIKIQIHDLSFDIVTDEKELIFHVEYSDNRLLLSNNILEFIKKLPENINELELINSYRDTLKIGYLNKHCFDNIRTLITRSDNYEQWYYPKGLEKHIMAHYDNSQTFITINKETHDYNIPVMFRVIFDNIHLFGKDMSLYTLSKNINAVVCYDLVDWGISSNYPKITQIDISKLPYIVKICTPKNVNVIYNENTVIHKIFECDGYVNRIIKTIKLK